MRVLNEQLEQHLQNWDLYDDDDDDDDDDDNQYNHHDGATDQTKPNTQNDVNFHIDGSHPERNNHHMHWNPLKMNGLQAAILWFFLGLGVRDSTDKMIPLLLLCSLIVFGSASVCFLWKFWLRSVSRQQQDRTNRCRLSLSRLLGTIGAPLLDNNTEQTTTLPLGSKDAKAITEFSTSQVALLVAVENSLEKLQCATSFQLQLGPWSPSVQRVELSACRPSMPAAKRLVGECLIQQRNRLIELLGSQPSKQDDGFSLLPSVVTLAWLRSIRNDIACILSEVLSEFLTTLAIRKEHDFPLICQQTLESQQHLETVFDIIDPRKQWGKRDKVTKFVDELSRQLHAAQIALWALRQQEGKEDHPYGEWMTRIQSVLSTAESLNQLWMEECLEGNEEDSSEQQELPSATNIRNVATDHTQQDFEHEGSKNEPGQSPPVDVPSDKTLVYSGKGAVRPPTEQQQQQRKHKPSEGGRTVSMNPARIMAEGILVQELRTRIEGMERREEHNMTNIDDCADETNDSSPKQEKEVFSKIMTGTSMALLSELRFCLDETGKDLDGGAEYES